MAWVVGETSVGPPSGVDPVGTMRLRISNKWREGLWKKMEGYRFGGKFLRVLKELYKESTCMVRFGEIETDWFEVKEGLKQGCSLSPVLFAFYLQS